MAVATNEMADGPRMRRPLRLWPGVVIVVLQWLARYVMPAVRPDLAPSAFLAALIGGGLLILWWLFFSRAPWSERLGAVALMAAAVAVTYQVVDP